jgi:hypothetical protein
MAGANANAGEPGVRRSRTGDNDGCERDRVGACAHGRRVSFGLRTTPEATPEATRPEPAAVASSVLRLTNQAHVARFVRRYRPTQVRIDVRPTWHPERYEHTFV